MKLPPQKHFEALLAVHTLALVVDPAQGFTLKMTSYLLNTLLYTTPQHLRDLAQVLLCLFGHLTTELPFWDNETLLFSI